MTVDPRTVIRDKVAEAIYTDSERLFPDVFPWSKLSAPEQDGYRKLADAAIAAHLEALEQAARIDTVEQLKSINPRPDLINGALIRVTSAPFFGAVFELNDDGTWNNFDATTPAEERIAPEDVPLPARVLYRPKEDS